MTRRTRSRQTVALAALGILAVGCSGTGGPPLAEVPLRREIAAALGSEVILPTYRELAAHAATLDAATAQYATTLDPADLEIARTAWLELMRVVERAEVMQIGPAGHGGTTVEAVMGGRGLEAEIYAWTVASPCRIDEETFEQTYSDLDVLAIQLVNVRTLGAIEYLLFVDSTANACSAASVINLGGAWTSIEAEIPSRRAAYAHALATLVRRTADELVAAWEPAQGNFLSELERAGAGSDVYPSAQEALNAISDAMFYLDVDTKDMKLGAPAGITMCLAPEMICPDLRESRFADESLTFMAENLAAFRSLFFGGEPGPPVLGFDDLLRALLAGTVADRMLVEIDEATAALAAIPEPFEEALATSLPTVVAAHAALTDVLTLYKTEVAAILDLDPPARAAGDND